MGENRSNIIERLFFWIAHLLGAYWTAFVVVLFVAGCIFGVNYYLELTRPPEELDLSLKVEDIGVTVIYPDKIDTGDEYQCRLSAELDAKDVVRSATFELRTTDPFATFDSLAFTETFSNTKSAAQWPIVLRYGNPKSPPEMFLFTLRARVDSNQESEQAQIRVDSTSKAIRTLGATIFAGLISIGTLIKLILDIRSKARST